jgi:hypothetical protein
VADYALPIRGGDRVASNWRSCRIRRHVSRRSRRRLGPSEGTRGTGRPASHGQAREASRCAVLQAPGLPPPSQIDHIIVTIGQDLSATAFINALQPRAKIKVNRTVNAGEPIYIRDWLKANQLGQFPATILTMPLEPLLQFKSGVVRMAVEPLNPGVAFVT